MKLAVGFLTYEQSSAKYLAEFLPSLYAALKFLPARQFQIYAFDNSEADDNANRLALEFFNRESSRQGIKTVTYFSRGFNLGFARAYNFLLQKAWEAEAEYFLIINPDTLLEPDSLRYLVAALDSEEDLVAVSPKLRRWDFSKRERTSLIDSCGLILKPGLRFLDLGQGEEDRGQFDRQPIIGPSGAAGLFRLSILEKIKEKRVLGENRNQYFDERFFMYKEDCDLAYRLYSAGYKCRLVPAAVIYHDRTAASSGAGFLRRLKDWRQKNRQIRAWSFRNQNFLFVKHWQKQNFVNKIIIAFRFFFFFIFSLILAQFLLKEYRYILFSKEY